MPLLLAPANEPADLRVRLAGLRRHSRRVVVRDGVVTLVIAWLAVLLLVGALDQFAHLPAILRAALLVTALVGSVLYVWHSVIGPWLSSRDDLALALQIEERFPELNDVLASAVEFERTFECGSASMRAATRRHATREAAGCDFDAVIDAHSLVRRGAVLAVLAAVAFTSVVVIPARSLTAVARSFDPFGNHPWPLDTNLSVTAPDWLARGDPFVLRGELSGVVPDRAEFHFAVDGTPSSVLALPVTKVDELGTFALRLEPNRVSRSFRFQVRANDAATPWRTVTVHVPPELADRDGRLSPQVHQSFPVYSGQAAVDLPDGGCIVEGVTGTVARIRAAVDRPIVRAWIALPSESPIRTGTTLTAIGGVDPVAAIAQMANGFAVSNSAPGYVEADGHRFEITFVPPVSGRYDLRFEDASGLAGHREFDVRIAADPSPKVHLERPAAGRDSLSVLPDAVVVFAARVEDPVFAVRSAWLEFQTSPNGEWRRSELAGPKFDPGSKRPQTLPVEHQWPLSSVLHVDGQPLQDGDTVTLAIAADDFDNVTTTKPAGRSHQVELRIVSPAGLRAIVQKSQADIQRELAALQELQRSAREKTAAAVEQRRNSGALQQTEINKVAESAQIQQQVRQRIGNEQDGLRASVERLRQMLRTNRLNDAAAETQRADGLSAELERLLREEIEPIEPLLAAAQTERGPVPPEARHTGPLPQANRFQKDAERTLQKLSERMQAWSEARELQAEAATLERDQERLMRQREQFENQPDVRGADSRGLRSDQREALARLAERQATLADRANELVQKLNQKAAEKRAAQQAKESESRQLTQQLTDGDPSQRTQLQAKAEDAKDAADLLAKQALALAKARDAAQAAPSLSAKSNEAVQSLGSNKLGDAKAAQAAAVATLRQVQDVLAEAPDRDVDRLAKRLAAAEQELDELLDEQERLQKRATDAQSITDPVARKEALDELAREQESLRQKTDDLAQRLSRLREESAAQDLRKATRSMDQAREWIDRGEPSESKQDQALDRLEDAQMQVAQARKRLNDELQRDRIVKLIDALKGFDSRQQALSSESERVFQAVRAGNSWSRALQKSLIDLAQSEQLLGNELAKFAEAKFEDAKVVAHILRETAAAMNEVGTAVETVRNGPMDMDAWHGDRQRIQSPQQLAARRLKQLLDIIQESDKEERNLKTRDEQNRKSDPNSSSSPPGDGLPSMAQLKLLRMLQEELNDRTSAFAKGHPDPGKWTAEDRAEILRLQASQAELAALLESLTPTEPPKEDKK